MNAIDERYLALIHAEIDGENSAEESAELARYLENRPDARELYGELQRLAQTLHAVERCDPPPELRLAILRGLRSTRRSGRPRHWPVLRYAAAFAGGLIVSAAVMQFGVPHGSRPDWSQLSGTMAPGQPQAAAAVADSLRIDLDQLSGYVRLHLAGEAAVIELDLTARKPVEIRLMLPGAEHAARLEPGEHRYGLMPVERMDATIGVKLFADGALIHEGSLAGPAGN